MNERVGLIPRRRAAFALGPARRMRGARPAARCVAEDIAQAAPLAAQAAPVLDPALVSITVVGAPERFLWLMADPWASRGSLLPHDCAASEGPERTEEALRPPMPMLGGAAVFCAWRSPSRPTAHGSRRSWERRERAGGGIWLGIASEPPEVLPVGEYTQVGGRRTSRRWASQRPGNAVPKGERRALRFREGPDLSGVPSRTRRLRSVVQEAFPTGLSDRPRWRARRERRRRSRDGRWCQGRVQARGKGRDGGGVASRAGAASPPRSAAREDPAYGPRRHCGHSTRLSSGPVGVLRAAHARSLRTLRRAARACLRHVAVDVLSARRCAPRGDDEIPVERRPAFGAGARGAALREGVEPRRRRDRVPHHRREPRPGRRFQTASRWPSSRKARSRLCRSWARR